MQRVLSVSLVLVLCLAMFASSAQAQVFFGPPQPVVYPSVTVTDVWPAPVRSVSTPSLQSQSYILPPTPAPGIWAAPGIWVKRDVDGSERWVLLGSTVRSPARWVAETWVYRDRDTLVRVPGHWEPEQVEERWLEIGPRVSELRLQEPLRPIQSHATPTRSEPGVQRHSTINRAEFEPVQEAPIRHSTIYVDPDNDAWQQPELAPQTPSRQPDSSWRPARPRTYQSDDVLSEPVKEAPPKRSQPRAPEADYLVPSSVVRTR